MKQKEKILNLRSKGYTYQQIIDELGCSKGTISFHCGAGQKAKTAQRKKERANKYPLKVAIEEKLDNFLNTKRPLKQNSSIGKLNRFNKNVYGKCFRFHGKKSATNMSFASEEILKKLKESGNKCELTGRPLNLDDTKSWHLDHIVPKSKGGANTIENCQILCREANQAKHSMMQEDFLSLCIDVLQHNGYIVSKDAIV